MVICCRVDQHKQVSIRKKIASLCAADVTLKEFAQRVINYFKLLGDIRVDVIYLAVLLDA